MWTIHTSTFLITISLERRHEYVVPNYIFFVWRPFFEQGIITHINICVNTLAENVIFSDSFIFNYFSV